MNIIPVNVHALMRGMPLAPLYNYTYTFEENARLALGISTAAAAAAHEPTNAREWFFKILENPYYDSPISSGGASHRNIQTLIPSFGSVVPFVTTGDPSVISTVTSDQAAVDNVKRASSAAVNLLNTTAVATYKPALPGAAAADATKMIVDVTAAAAAAVPANDTVADAVSLFLQSAILSGAYSTPVTDVVATRAATRSIATLQLAIAAINAALRATCSGNGANNAVVDTQALMVAFADNVVANLIIARDNNRANLRTVLLDEINDTIVALIDGAAAGAAAGRIAINAVTVDAAKAAVIGVPADIVTRIINNIRGTEQPGSLLGILRAVAGGNAPTFNQNMSILVLLARIGALTAALNNLKNNNTMARYSLDRNVSTNDRTLAALMHGDETLLMGRPKFISDQLFHKVLPTLNSAGEMTYYENGVPQTIPAAGIAVNARDVFEARFNTRIVRNLMHCTNVQRVLRLRLNQELTSYRDVLVNRESITNPSVTEFGNLRWSDMRLGPGTDNRTMDPRNEDARSRTYNSEEVVGIPR